MPFVQGRIDKITRQTRNIFDKYIYRPENGDSLNDVLQFNYFEDLRFDDDISIIDCILSDGYFTVKASKDGEVELIYSDLQKRMSLASVDDITINGSLAAPSYITGLSELPRNNPGFVPTLTGVNADEDTGAVVNNTGNTLTMSGLISIESDTGGFTSSVTVWSEFSDDGINWTPQQLSKRDWSIAFIAEGSQTNESAVKDWMPGQYLRFAFALAGGSTVILSNNPITVNGDQMVDGFSVKWSLDEVIEVS